MEILINNKWIHFDMSKIEKRIIKGKYPSLLYNNIKCTKSKIKFICTKCGKEQIQNIKSYTTNICSDCKEKQTNLKRYGVEYIFYNKEKIKQSMLDKYNVTNPFQSDKIKEKIKQTNLQRYGVEYVSQSKEIQEKIKQTNLKRYGVQHHMQSITQLQQFKRSMLNMWGVEHPMYNRDICEKVISNGYRSMSAKKYLTKFNHNLYYRSNPELNFIKTCDDLNIEVKNGPSIKYILENKEHMYHIDFETNKYLIEIKASHYWYKQDLANGTINAKNKAAQKHAASINKEFLFLLDIKDYKKMLS